LPQQYGWNGNEVAGVHQVLMILEGDNFLNAWQNRHSGRSSQ